MPTTYLRTSFFWDNLIHFGMHPQRDDDGVLALTMPMGDQRLPGIAADDIGRTAYAIFQRGEEYVGKTVGIAGEHLTGAEMADALSDALGEKVRYNAIDPETYRSFDFDGADDLGNMYQVKRDFNDEYVGHRSIEETRSLNPSLQTFREWLGRNKDRIPAG